MRRIRSISPAVLTLPWVLALSGCLGPGLDAGGAFSEGLLDLEGQGHFLYANLNPEQQETAETIIASIRKTR